MQKTMKHFQTTMRR